MSAPMFSLRYEKRHGFQRDRLTRFASHIWSSTSRQGTQAWNSPKKLRITQPTASITSAKELFALLTRHWKGPRKLGQVLGILTSVKTMTPCWSGRINTGLCPGGTSCSHRTPRCLVDPTGEGKSGFEVTFAMQVIASVVDIPPVYI